jgi:hypothetical protein
MTTHETAVRIWQVLIAAAHQRRTLSRETLGALIGISGAEVAPPLGELARHCAANGWPPLTTLVLTPAPQNPARGPAADGDAEADRLRVYEHRWFTMPPVTVARLEEADRPARRPCPTCGREGNAEATLCGYCWTRLTPQSKGAGH